MVQWKMDGKSPNMIKYEFPKSFRVIFHEKPMIIGRFLGVYLPMGYLMISHKTSLERFRVFHRSPNGLITQRGTQMLSTDHHLGNWKVPPWDCEESDVGMLPEIMPAQKTISLRIQICPQKGISPIILLWGWEWDHQSYSREGSGFLG